MPDHHLYLSSVDGPHCAQPVAEHKPEAADRVLILLHGRGGLSWPVLQWGATHLPQAWVMAPQAMNNTWYPERFMEPTASNVPYLESALAAVDALVLEAIRRGCAKDAIIIGGFSQGACLAAEYLKRHPGPYAGGLIMSGGLIGTDSEVREAVAGDMASTPVYIGCDEDDPHIPWSRVQDTIAYFDTRGADVHIGKYQGLGHTIHPDAIKFIQAMAA